MIVAIYWAARCVHVKIKTTKSAQTARAFLKAVRAKAPFRIRQLPAGNDKAFTNRLQTERRAPSGGHIFDKPCAKTGIEHQPTPVHRPQTNGMLERFNCQVSDVSTDRQFDPREALQNTLKRCCHLCESPHTAKNAESPNTRPRFPPLAAFSPASIPREVRDHVEPDN